MERGGHAPFGRDQIGTPLQQFRRQPGGHRRRQRGQIGGQGELGARIAADDDLEPANDLLFGGGIHAFQVERAIAIRAGERDILPAHLPDPVLRLDQPHQIVLHHRGFRRGEPQPLRRDRLVPQRGDGGGQRLACVEQVGIRRLSLCRGGCGLRANASPQVELPGDLADESRSVLGLVASDHAGAAREGNLREQQRARLRDQPLGDVYPRGGRLKVEIVQERLVHQHVELDIAERLAPTRSSPRPSRRQRAVQAAGNGGGRRQYARQRLVRRWRLLHRAPARQRRHDAHRSDSSITAEHGVNAG